MAIPERIPELETESASKPAAAHPAPAEVHPAPAAAHPAPAAAHAESSTALVHSVPQPKAPPTPRMPVMPVISRINLRRIPSAVDPLGTKASGLETTLIPFRLAATNKVFGGLQQIQHHVGLILQTLLKPKLPPKLVGALHQPDGSAAARVQVQFLPSSVGKTGPHVSVLTGDDGGFTLSMPSGAEIPAGGLPLTVHGANSNTPVTIPATQISASGMIGVTVLPVTLTPLPVSILTALAALVPTTGGQAGSSTPLKSQAPTVTIGEPGSVCVQSFSKNATVDRFPWGVFFRLVEPQLSIVSETQAQQVPGGKFNWLPTYATQGRASDSGAASPGKSSSDGSSPGGSGSGGSSQGGASQAGSSSSSQGGSSLGGSSTVGASQNPSQKGGASSSDPGSSTSNSGSGPAPGNFIPGGLGPVPGGLTGLGGTAGTGAGFGVGTLLPGGGGSAPPSNLPYYVDPALTAQLVQSLMGLVQNAASPDALEAQNLILRRMALEGDVIGSRMPPPRNISEIGGYLNLLGTLKEKAMREQALAGILGVAGPVNALGWTSNVQPLSMVAVTNDRPPVAAQSSFPLTVLIRSDFVGPFQAALKTLHSYGATLPLTSPSVIVLPAGGTGAVVPPTSSILFYLGRAVTIAPSAALAVPGADPIALVSAISSGPFQLASNVLNPPTASVPVASQASGDLFTVVCSPTSQTVFQLTTSPYILIAPTLAAAGYYPSFPVPVPANSTIHAWATLTNTTGLVAGTTELGDELSLLYRQDQIAGSVFAAMLSWTWNGSSFAP